MAIDSFGGAWLEMTGGTENGAFEVEDGIVVAERNGGGVSLSWSARRPVRTIYPAIRTTLVDFRNRWLLGDERLKRHQWIFATQLPPPPPDHARFAVPTHAVLEIPESTSLREIQIPFEFFSPLLQPAKPADAK
jgi:hypothetical protein